MHMAELLAGVDSSLETKLLMSFQISCRDFSLRLTAGGQYMTVFHSWLIPAVVSRTRDNIASSPLPVLSSLLCAGGHCLLSSAQTALNFLWRQRPFFYIAHFTSLKIGIWQSPITEFLFWGWFWGWGLSDTCRVTWIPFSSLQAGYY